MTVGGEPSRLIRALVAGRMLTAFSKKRMRILALEPNRGLTHLSELFERGRIR